jgi:glutamate-1-semialdehyde 2,1-aminomutase
MVQIMFTEQAAINDYRAYYRYVDRAKYQRFVRELFQHGAYMTPAATLHSIVSLVHTEEDVEMTLAAVRRVLTDSTW